MQVRTTYPWPLEYFQRYSSLSLPKKNRALQAAYVSTQAVRLVRKRHIRAECTAQLIEQLAYCDLLLIPVEDGTAHDRMATPLPPLDYSNGRRRAGVTAVAADTRDGWAA